MPANSCSLIISTYNRPDALYRCLQSVFVQTVLPSEIIIADDGSRSETRQLIENLKKETTIPLLHIWQPDEGYRLARIRNKAFAAAGTELLIQIDGDLILHHHFIKDHIRMATPGVFVSGSRTMADATLTRHILEGKTAIKDIPAQRAHLSKQYNAWHSPIMCRINYWLQRSRRNYKYVLGCNMAFWKKDLEKVNGYNESFTGWGKEDNDLAVRLMNAGVRLRFIKYGATAYHLYHSVSDLSSVPANEKMLQKTIEEKITFIQAGMKQHDV